MTLSQRIFQQKAFLFKPFFVHRNSWSLAKNESKFSEKNFSSKTAFRAKGKLPSLHFDNHFSRFQIESIATRVQKTR